MPADTPPIIELPNGYNGHTMKFYVEPIERDGDLVKLRCAEPGKQFLIRWAYADQVELLHNERIAERITNCGF